MHLRILAAILLVSATGNLFAGPVLLDVQVVPSLASFTTGQIITVDTLISGIAATGATELGSFDIFIGFDPALVTPLSVSFGPYLGDPLLFEALTDFIFQPAIANVAEVSLLTNAELQALQPDSFNLATITFEALQDGVSDFQFLGGPIDDGYGILIGGTKPTAVPEPGGVVLVAIGIAAVFFWRRRYAAQASLSIAVLAAGVAQAQPAAGIVPLFTPGPAGIAIPDSARMDRDPATILILPQSKVGTTGGARHQPSIAVNPLQTDRYAIGVNDYTLSENGNCVAFYSTNSAQTWTVAAGGPFPTQANYAFSGSPSVAFDHQNNVYFSCLNHNRLKTLPSAVHVFKSNDGGASYGVPQTVALGAGGGEILERPYLTTDWFNNKVYVTWTRSNAAGTSDIMFAGSTDGGASFASPAPHALSQPNHSQSHDSVPASGSAANQVYVAWEDSTRPSIMVSKSNDGGASFNALAGDVVVADQITPFPTRFLSAFPGSYPAIRGEFDYFRVNSKPSIDVCRNPASPFFGHVYITWADNRNGDGDIFFSRSVNGGTSWSAPKRVNDDALGNSKDQFFPWIAVDPLCKINIAFYDRREDPANRKFHSYVTDSVDSGVIFSKNARVSTAPSTDINFAGQYIGDHIGLAATDNALGIYHHQVQRSVPAWMDSTVGPNQN